MNEGMPTTSLSFKLNGQSIELILPEGSFISGEKDGGVNINTGKGEVSVLPFPENVDSRKLADVFLQGLPSSFAFYPALFFGPKISPSSPLKLAIQGRRGKELSNTIAYSLTLGKKPKSLAAYLKKHGIFLYGASKVQEILKSKIDLPINGIVTAAMMNGVSYAFAMDKNKGVFFSSSPEVSPNFIINFNGLKSRLNIVRSMIDQADSSSIPGMGQLMKGLPNLMNK